MSLSNKLSYGCKDAAEMLSEFIKDHSNYNEVDKPGSFKTKNVREENKLFIIRMPKNMVQAKNLIGSEIVIGGNKKRSMQLNNEEFDLSTIPIEGTDPAMQILLLPDSRGKLHKVDTTFKGQIVIKKKQPLNAAASMVNIDELRSTSHVPPEDLSIRSFFSPPSCDHTDGNSRKKKKKKKDKQKDKSLNESDMSINDSIKSNKLKKEPDNSFETVSPQRKSSKKKKHLESTQETVSTKESFIIKTENSVDNISDNKSKKNKKRKASDDVEPPKVKLSPKKKKLKI